MRNEMSSMKCPNLNDCCDILKNISVDDVKQYLTTARSLHTEAVGRKDELETELYYLQGLIPLKHEKLLKLRKETEILLSELTARSQELKSETNAIYKRLENGEKLQSAVKRIQQTQNLHTYLFGLQHLENLNKEAVVAAESSDWQAVGKVVLQMIDMQMKVKGSKCIWFVDFLNTLISGWQTSLKNYIESVLNDIFAQIGYPFQNEASFLENQAANESISVVRSLLMCYHQVIPLRSLDSISNDCFSSRLPFIDLLVGPIASRFAFHFCGDRKTNAPHKPEWYFTQVVKWVKANQSFVCEVGEEIIRSAQLHYIAVDEFSRRLVGLAAGKLRESLQSAADDVTLFSHIVDATVIFEMEMKNLGYPDNEPNCLDILADGDHLDIWLGIEHICNTEKAEMMLNCVSAWRNRYQTASDVDDFKVPECADGLLTLLQMITERYKLIRNPVARLKFLSLQQTLLDDFRVRLLQLTRNVQSAWDGRYLQILNAVAYITYVLSEWNDSPFFLILQQRRLEMREQERKLIPNLISGAFDSVMNLYDHMLKEMLQTIIDALLAELTTCLGEFQRQHWYDMKGPPVNLSASFCPFLLKLRERVTILETELSDHMFKKAIRVLASNLNQFLYNNLLLKTHFSESGATQMKYDIDSGLFVLLRCYDTDILGYFARVSEALNILCLKTGSLLLLTESLNSGIGDSNAASVLEEFGAFSVETDDLKAIIAQRVDVLAGLGSI